MALDGCRQSGLGAAQGGMRGNIQTVFHDGAQLTVSVEMQALSWHCSVCLALPPVVVLSQAAPRIPCCPQVKVQLTLKRLCSPV